MVAVIKNQLNSQINSNIVKNTNQIFYTTSTDKLFANWTRRKVAQRQCRT